MCNISGEANTVCHTYVKMLVRRVCYHILKNYILPNGRCPNCGALVAELGMNPNLPH